MASVDVRDRDLYAVEQFDITEAYRSDLKGILLSQEEIATRVTQLAAAITKEHRSNTDLYPVCVLKGAMRFFVDLLRELELTVPYSEGIIYSSRYQSGPNTTTPSVQFFQKEQFAGKDVLLVEDMIDEGHTLATLRDRIKELNPRSVTIATLFDAAVDRDVDVNPEFTGFHIPDAFFVGYGLDYAEQYRDIPHLGILKSEVVADT